MEVILLEKVGKLGIAGGIVKVKNGYGRNYLIPRKKAMRATEDAKELFRLRRSEIERGAQERKIIAQEKAEKIKDLHVIIERQCGEDGRLYGSVTTKDIAKKIATLNKVEIDPHDVQLNFKFKEIGVYRINLMLHPEVQESILLNIARNIEEANSAFKDYQKEQSATPKS